MLGEVDGTIPTNTAHSISVNLPTWQSVLDYVDDVNTHSNIAPDTEVFQNGYPRVKLNPIVKKLCTVLCDKYAKENESCLCFPSYNVAKRCREYIRFKSRSNVKIRILQLATSKPMSAEEKMWKKECKIAVVFVKIEYYPIMKEYWQLSGEIISSSIAEYVLHELFVIASMDNNKNESSSFKIDKDLNFTFTERAKKLIKKRITRNFMDLNGENEDENYHFHENGSNSNLNSTFIDSETSTATSNNNSSAVSRNNHLAEWNLDFENDESNNEDDDDEEEEDRDDLIESNIVNSLIPPEPIDMSTASTEESTLVDTHQRRESRSVINDEDSTASLVNPEADVFLFPSGMASLFTTLRLLLQFDLQRVNRSRTNANNSTTPGGSNNSATTTSSTPPTNSSSISIGNRSNQNSTTNTTSDVTTNVYKRTVMFGLPYNDTLKMLKAFNNTYFLPNGECESMNQLKKILHSGEQILAVFIEAPSNPLLKMGNIIELKELSEMFGFYIIIDESIGGFVNIDGLAHADIVCSSLTKIFSGETGTMAGSLVLNPQSKLYTFAQEFLSEMGEYEDNLWTRDALILERDSRDYVARAMKINSTTDYILDNVIIPYTDKLFKKLYHPRFTSPATKNNYETIKCKKDGGYGSTFSVTFNSLEQAQTFYDCLEIYKGPSLGSNLTTACPYTIMQYGKDSTSLQEAVKYGLDETLVRVSIGLESRKTLCTIFQDAIDKAMTVA